MQRELAAERGAEVVCRREEKARREEREITTTRADPTAAIRRAEKPVDFGFG